MADVDIDAMQQGPVARTNLESSFCVKPWIICNPVARVFGFVVQKAQTGPSALCSPLLTTHGQTERLRAFVAGVQNVFHLPCTRRPWAVAWAMGPTVTPSV
jgi:hypothetical protein